MAESTDYDDQGDSSEVSERPSGADQTGKLAVKNLVKTFESGSIVACEDISFEVGPDEFVVLLGPSGCGKSTTLRCIAGLEIPDDGQIMIGNEDVTRAKPKDRNLAFVFQSIALFPHMTVRENIRFGLDMTTDLSMDEKEKKVVKVAETLEISELLDRNPSELSGGQQQRVSIGRAMVLEPSAFLLDEPFSNLDANLRNQLQLEVKKLHQELNTATIFVTHDQAEAMTLATKIVIMQNGHIQQVGTPHEIYNEPKNLFVATFIGSPSTNIIPCSIERGEGTIRLYNDTFSFELNGENIDDLEYRADEDVLMGIRPDHVNVGASGIFEAEVDLIEPEGSRDSVYLKSGDLEITSEVEQGAIEPDRSYEVDFQRDEIWLFDESGTRLL